MNSIFKVTPVPIGTIRNTILLFVVLIFGLADLHAQSPQVCASGQNIVASGFQCTIGGLTFSPFPQNASSAPVFITSAFVQPSGAVELDLSRGNQLSCCGNFFLEVVGRVTSVTVTNLVVNSLIFAEICSPVPCGFGQPTQSLGFIDPPDHKSGSLSFPAVSSLSVDGGDGPPSLDPFSLVFNAPICQVETTRIGQCEGKPHHWGGEPYAYHTDAAGTICHWGCTLSALSMNLKSVEVTTIPNFSKFISSPDPTSLDPGFLNSLMTRVPLVFLSDYDSHNNVQPGSTIRDIDGFLSLNLRFDETLRGAQLLTDLDSAVCHGGHPGTDKDKPTAVVVQVRSQCSGQAYGHYVLVTGKTAGSSGNMTFKIDDPAGAGFDATGNAVAGVCLNGQPVATCKTLDCPAYANDFKIRGWVSDPTGDMSELDISVGDSADLLVANSTGARTGFDPQSASVIREIPNSSHGEDRVDDDETGEVGLTSRSVDIFQPVVGTYSIQVSGLKLGTLMLTLMPFAQDNTPEPRLSVPIITAPGSSSNFLMQFQSAPGSASNVIRTASFQGTLDDISNSLQLGLIDNSGIANSLAKKVQHAGFATGQDRINSLTAFINEVQAQAGKHITGVAAQVLLEDAQSVLTAH